jgi:prepilin-type N-terminal cleavage/methylation domain-containing protein
MLRKHPGFTTTELLMVMALLSVVLAMVMPKFHSVQARANVRSAKQTVAAQLATARAAAIRRGYPARVTTNGNTIQISIADSVGAYTALSNTIDLGEQYKVDLSTCPEGGTCTTGGTTLDFDPRGFATGVSTVQRYVIDMQAGRYSARSDTVCVSRMGVVLPRGCNL